MIYRSKYTGTQVEEILDFHSWEYIYDSVGDVVYHDGTKLRSISYKEWNSELGTPIGIVVIPSGIVGDARIIALNEAMCMWDPDAQYVDWAYAIMSSNTSLYGAWDEPVYLPSDHFSGCANPNDLNTAYHSDTECEQVNQAPPPFKNGKLFQPFTGYHFDGVWATSSTTDLLDSAFEYCRSYSVMDDISGWHLPTCGELAFCLYHMDVINEALSAVGGTELGEHEYWTADGRQVYTTVISDEVSDETEPQSEGEPAVADYWDDGWDSGDGSEGETNPEDVVEHIYSFSINFTNGKICWDQRNIAKAVRPFKIWK